MVGRSRAMRILRLTSHPGLARLMHPVPIERSQRAKVGEVREMAHWLRTFTALTEDHGLVPRNHMESHNYL